MLAPRGDKMSNTVCKPEDQAPSVIEPRWRRPDCEKVERNAALVAHYLVPHSMRQTAAEFGISVPRVQRIIAAAGVQAHSKLFRSANG